MTSAALYKASSAHEWTAKSVFLNQLPKQAVHDHRRPSEGFTVGPTGLGGHGQDPGDRICLWSSWGKGGPRSRMRSYAASSVRGHDSLLNTRHSDKA